MAQSLKIKRYLQSQYPELSSMLGQMKTIPKLQKREMSLPDAVVRVITGQMLSAQVARVIFARIQNKANEKNLVGTWLLDHESLRSCGLSRAKAQAICNVGVHVGTNINAFEHWRGLSSDDLFLEIKQFRGMGEWTASIIALGYVGHEDVFPASDGSLQRAITFIQGRKKGRKKSFDPDKAAPYRSYLALYLWEALDTGLLGGPAAKRRSL